MPPRQAGPLSLEALSPQWHQPSSLVQQSATDRKHSWRSNTSPTAPLLRKASQAVLASSLPLHVGQSGAGLPLAPWPLRLCWGSPEPETHSQRVLLHRIQDWACEDLLRPGPSNAIRAKLCQTAPRLRLPNGTNRAPGGCSLQRDRKRSSGSTHQPQGAKTQESYASRFRTQRPRSQSGKVWLGFPWVPEAAA